MTMRIKTCDDELFITIYGVRQHVNLNVFFSTDGMRKRKNNKKPVDTVLLLQLDEFQKCLYKMISSHC